MCDVVAGESEVSSWIKGEKKKVPGDSEQRVRRGSMVVLSLEHPARSQHSPYWDFNLMGNNAH